MLPQYPPFVKLCVEKNAHFSDFYKNYSAAGLNFINLSINLPLISRKQALKGLKPALKCVKTV